MYCFKYPAVTGKFSIFSLFKIFFQYLFGCVNSLDRRCKMHLNCFLELVILQIQITIIGTFGIFFEFLFQFRISVNKKTGLSLTLNLSVRRTCRNRRCPALYPMGSFPTMTLCLQQIQNYIHAPIPLLHG